MDALAVLLSVSVPVLLGVCLVRYLGLRRRDDPIAYLGWCYVTGLVGIGVYLAAWLVLGLPLSRTLILPPLALTIVLAWSRPWRKAPIAPGDAQETRRIPRPYLWFVTVLVCLALVDVVHGNRIAVTFFDEASIWALKAKMIYAAGGLGQQFEQLAAELDRPEGYWTPLTEWFTAQAAILQQAGGPALPDFTSLPVNHLDYPALNPLVQLWSFICAGEIQHWQNRLLVQLCAVALLLILAGSLVQNCRAWVAAILLLLFYPLADTQGALRMANADGMVATGLFVAFDCIRRWRGDGQQHWLRLAGVGLALMLWSKHEGLMYLVALVLAAAFAGLRLPRRTVLYSILPLAVLAFTWISNTVFGFENDLVAGASRGGIERLPRLFEYLWQNVLAGPLWATDAARLQSNFLYPAFLLLLCAAPRRVFGKELRFATCTVLAILAGQVLVYATTPHKLDWHLQTSAMRFTWQALPVAMLWIGIRSRELLGPRN